MPRLVSFLLPLIASAAVGGSNAVAQVVFAPKDMVTIVVLKDGASINGISLSVDELDKRLTQLSAKRPQPPMDVISPGNDVSFKVLEAMRERVAKHGLKLVAKVGFVTKP